MKIEVAGVVPVSSVETNVADSDVKSVLGIYTLLLICLIKRLEKSALV